MESPQALLVIQALHRKEEAEETHSPHPSLQSCSVAPYPGWGEGNLAAAMFRAAQSRVALPCLPLGLST